MFFYCIKFHACQGQTKWETPDFFQTDAPLKNTPEPVSSHRVSISSRSWFTPTIIAVWFQKTFSFFFIYQHAFLNIFLCSYSNMIS